MEKRQTMATCISCILQLVCKYEACKALSHSDQMITVDQILCQAIYSAFDSSVVLPESYTFLCKVLSLRTDFKTSLRWFRN